jgi:hypothetical protein
MNRRVRVGVVAVGVCMSSVATAGCARREMGYRNTAPIRTEPPTTSPPTTVVLDRAVGAPELVDSTTSVPNPASTVTTVVLTDAEPAPAAELMSAEVATSTKLAPGTPGFVPAPIPDGYVYPVIVKVKAKTPLEQEVLDASVDLFAKYEMNRLRLVKSREEWTKILTGKLATDILKRVTRKTILTEVGPVDRTVVESMRKVTKSSAYVRVCTVDSTRSYEMTSGEWKDMGDVVQTAVVEFQIVRTPAGWRISKDTYLGIAEGVDRCVGK